MLLTLLYLALLSKWYLSKRVYVDESDGGLTVQAYFSNHSLDLRGRRPCSNPWHPTAQPPTKLF